MALDRLVRRLRGLSPRAWQQRGREPVIRRLLVDLADVGASGRSVPDLPVHALADAVAVLGYDALQADEPRAQALIDAALEATR